MGFINQLITGGHHLVCLLNLHGAFLDHQMALLVILDHGPPLLKNALNSPAVMMKSPWFFKNGGCGSGNDLAKA